jgi:hypothetical protein
MDAPIPEGGATGCEAGLLEILFSPDLIRIYCESCGVGIHLYLHESITTFTFQIALPSWAEDHDKRRSKSVPLFKLIPLPIPHKPCIVEEGIEDNGPILWRREFQNSRFD